MEANNFVAILKADGSPKDVTDLPKLYQHYKTIISSLPAKDRAPFSLNVLCTLCRNLDKVTSWRSAVDPGYLLTLTIDCLRECRALPRTEQVKALAALYHIHKFAVSCSPSISPELVLKVSYMAFEREPTQLLKEYCKTYWNIFVDRLSFIEKLQKNKRSITKLLPKIIEDLIKVIQLFDSVLFCTSNIVFTVKKLHYLYNESAANELNKAFGSIFECLSSKDDLKSFKKLSEKDMLDLYTKLNDCLYVVAENSSKLQFKDTMLSLIVRVCVSLVGHCPDLHHCLQTFQLNVFCSLLSDQCTSTYTDTIFNSLLHSCETAEKLGYKKAMYTTYPYMNQLLRLYIDYYVANQDKWEKFFTIQIQECFLRIIMILMKKLRLCNQLLKCENCTVKSGLHDSLRLSFSTKYFIELSVARKMNVAEILPTYFNIVEEQNRILNELQHLKCQNYIKYHRKFQTEVHNTAINLNRSLHYEFSIKLFDLYLNNELKNCDSEFDVKNISRALFNKSICELDAKLYENSLLNAYLSLVFEYKNLATDKYMNLVMDIKNKSLKCEGKSEESEERGVKNDLVMMTVYEACDFAIKRKMYGDLAKFFSNLSFSELLSHEFEMYKKSWPYMAALAGVCKSIVTIIRNKPTWMNAQNEDFQEILYKISLDTPTFAVTICDHRYNHIISELLQLIDEGHKGPTEQLVQATLLFIRSEYELNEANKKYSWNYVDPNLDPENAPMNCTLAQEHEALKYALQAVDILSQAVPNLDSVPQYLVKHAIKTADVFVAQLLYYFRIIHGLQLAYLCCLMAEYVDDKESYVRNAGTIIYHSSLNQTAIDELLAKGTKYSLVLLDTEYVDTALNFVCEKAMYYARFNNLGDAARLLRLAQAKILSLKEKQPDINLDFSIGRLMEAQTCLCGHSAPSYISAVASLQRHYITFENHATLWHQRRLTSTRRRYRLTLSTLLSIHSCVSLHCWRRARAAGQAGRNAAGGVGKGMIDVGLTNVYVKGDSEAKIEYRLKYLLGLDTKESAPTKAKPVAQTATPRPNIEVMLENTESRTFKIIETSPTNFDEITQYVSFEMPPFLKHISCCQCQNCQVPHAAILTAHTCQLEASVYFRNDQIEVAKDYFENTLKCFDLAEQKIMNTCSDFKKKYEGFILDIVQNNCLSELRKVLINTLIEASFCELADKRCANGENHRKVDEYIIRIHEIMQVTDIDSYLHNQVMNLVITSAEVRKVFKSPRVSIQVTELESEMENLKLSPAKELPQPKTPESKHEPPQIPKIVVKDEEIPKTKRRVIKLNLDENGFEESNVKRTSKRAVKPTFLKPELELMTPMTNRKVPQESKIDENIYATPKPKRVEDDFVTPLATPGDQFFTPMTSLKTYPKKTLRKEIVKNLEAEFSTPKNRMQLNKENVLDTKNRDVQASTSKVTRSRLEASSTAKKTLKRVTSPGKLAPEKARIATRAKKPINFDDSGMNKK